MDIAISNYILAIVTVNADKIIPGPCPVFLAADQEEQEKLSLLLARILGA